MSFGVGVGVFDIGLSCGSVDLIFALSSVILVCAFFCFRLEELWAFLLSIVFMHEYVALREVFHHY